MDGGGFRVFERRVELSDDEGCAFIIDGAGPCGAPRRPRSPYCAAHHALCHVAGGSSGERRRLAEAEALATVVGGKQGRRWRLPPDPLLRGFARGARVFSRPGCSRIVRFEREGSGEEE